MHQDQVVRLTIRLGLSRSVLLRSWVCWQFAFMMRAMVMRISQNESHGVLKADYSWQ
jgi:hypothetical protein